MTHWLQGSEWYCFNCGFAHELHSAAEMCPPREPRQLLPGEAAQLAPEPASGASFGDYDQKVENAIHAAKEALDAAQNREDRLYWQGVFYGHLGKRRRLVRELMEAQRMRRALG